jgi:hypothetical protein
MKNKRFYYLLSGILVMIFGLLSRRLTYYIPDIINLFLGDALWALMIYFLIRFVFIKLSVKKSFIISVTFCYAIEISQLYHSGWIDNIRGTMIGGLILGYGFLWSDLAAYLIGIGAGVLLDCRLWHFKVRPQNALCRKK